MKKKFYDVGTLLYVRNQKHGLETLAIVGIGAAVASTAVGVTSALSNANAQSEANALNAEMNAENLKVHKDEFQQSLDFNRIEAEKTRQFNSEEAALTRDFNANQAQLNRTFQAGQLDKSIKQYENWNSAKSQYKRYLAAGLNPATLAGNLQSGQGFGIPSGSSASASSASASPASISPGGIPSPIPVKPVHNELGSVLGEALDNASSIFTMNKTNEETKGIVTENKFKEQLKDLDVTAKQATINKMYRDMRYLDTKINESSANIDLINKTIDKMDSEIGNIDSQTQYTNMKKFFESAQYEEVLQNLVQHRKLEYKEADALLKVYASQVAKNRGEAAAAYAKAELDKATSKLKPDEQQQIRAYINLLDKQSFKVQKEGNRISTQDYLDTFFAYPERQRGMDISSQELENARYKNTFLFRLLNHGESVSRDIGDAMMLYYGGRSLMK